MGQVDLSCVMKPWSAVAMDRVGGAHGLGSAPGLGGPGAVSKIDVRLALMPKGTPGVDPSHLWAWAIVESGEHGEPDRILVGGGAESLTEAAARGESALSEVLSKRAEQTEKAGG